MMYILSLILFLVCMGGNVAVAIVSWLLFVCFIMPDDWKF